MIAGTIAAAVLLMVGTSANAAIVPTVQLGTAASYAVLGGSTVTNTGNTTLNGSLGLAPGTSITGFPPGQVVPPGTTDVNNPAAQQAQADLTAAYVDAANRPLNATTPADLANLTLQGGVYAGPSKSSLSLTGPLILDGAGDANSVFIFQTDSTLTTASSSTVTLINNAQECNVFWLVGSSATLGTSSNFAGTILALASITVTTGVTVRGRALARNAAVTLDTDTFIKPTCAQNVPATTTTTTSPTTTTTGVTTTTTSATTTTTTGVTTTTTSATTTTTTSPTTTTTGAAATTTTGATGARATTTTRATTSATVKTPPGSPGVVTTTTGPGPEIPFELPRTGAPNGVLFLLAAIAITLGSVTLRFATAETAPDHTL